MELSNWISLVTGLFAGLGIGTALTSLIQHKLKKYEAVHSSLRKDLESRYRVIILLMYAAYDFETNKSAIRINRPDLKSKTDVLEELKAEWFNMLLFSSDTTQKLLHIFISSPNIKNLKECALSMRNDLGRGSLSDELNKLEFKNVNKLENS